MKAGMKTSELWLVVVLSAIALVLYLCGYSADEVRRYGEISVSRIKGAVIEWMPLVLAVAYVIQRGVLKVAEIWERVRSGPLPSAEEIEAMRRLIKEKRGDA